VVRIGKRTFSMGNFRKSHGDRIDKGGAVERATPIGEKAGHYTIEKNQY